MNTLHGAMREILASPDLIKRYAELGVEAKSSTPDEVQANPAVTTAYLGVEDSGE